MRSEGSSFAASRIACPRLPVSLSEEIAEAEKSLEQEHAKNELVDHAIRQTETEIDRLQSSLLNGAGQLSDLRNAQARCQENLQRVAARAAHLESERESKAQERLALSSELETVLREGSESRAAEREAALVRRADLEIRAATLSDRIDRSASVMTGSRKNTA